MKLKGYELVEELFCDSSGFGVEDEPALTQSQLINEVRSLVDKYGLLYTTITGVGQFQIYLGLFTKSGKKTACRIANNVLMVENKNGHTIRLYDTDIITIMDNGKIKLDSGGFRTATTKKWINQYLNGYTVYQKDFEWYVFNQSDKTTILFEDGMTI